MLLGPERSQQTSPQGWLQALLTGVLGLSQSAHWERHFPRAGQYRGLGEGASWTVF